MHGAGTGAAVPQAIVKICAFALGLPLDGPPSRFRLAISHTGWPWLPVAGLNALLKPTA